MASERDPPHSLSDSLFHSDPASLSTSEARRRVAAAAKAALRGDLMIRAAGSASVSHVDALFFRHLTAAACEMLALAEPGGAESRGDGGADDDAAIRALTPPHFIGIAAVDAHAYPRPGNAGRVASRLERARRRGRERRGSRGRGHARCARRCGAASAFRCEV